MAEYKDVIKHFKRMCKYYNNVAKQSDCLLYCKGHGCNISHCRLLAFEDKKFQNVVMAWAAENPEPVYPAWFDWLESMGILTTETVLNASKPNSTSTMQSYVTLIKSTPKTFHPIPTDIAQKLGIEPRHS